MGHVQVRDRVDADGRPYRRYIAKWQDADGRPCSKSFKGKTLADNYLSVQESKVITGQFTSPLSELTVSAYADRWLSGRGHKPQTRRNIAGLIKTHISGQDIGKRRVDRVARTDVEAWASDRRGVLALSSARRVVGLLRSIMQAAADDGAVTRNPVPKRVSLQAREGDGRVRTLTASQVQAMSAALPAGLRLLPMILAGCGLRIGEALGLMWSDVDCDGGTVKIVAQLDRDTRERTDPKTPSSRRTIPMPEYLIGALGAVRPSEGRDGYILTTGATGAGNVYGHSVASAAWTRACKKVGHASTPHDGRHTYASVLLSRGVDIVTVASRLGHADPSETLRTYAHFLPDLPDRTAELVNDWYQGTVAE